MTATKWDCDLCGQGSEDCEEAEFEFCRDGSAVAQLDINRGSNGMIADLCPRCFTILDGAMEACVDLGRGERGRE